MHARRCTTAACSYRSNWPDRTCAIFVRFFVPLFSTVRKLEAADNEGENFVDLERGTVTETSWEENWQTKVKRDVSASMARFFLLSTWYVRACHITDFFEKMGHAKENVRNEISRVSIVRFIAKRTRLRYKAKRTKTIGKKRTALKVWKKCDTIWIIKFRYSSKRKKRGSYRDTEQAWNFVYGNIQNLINIPP